MSINTEEIHRLESERNELIAEQQGLNGSRPILNSNGTKNSSATKARIDEIKRRLGEIETEIWKIRGAP